MKDSNSIQQSWPTPSNPRPISIIGAGAIVTDAHLPAYRKANFLVHSIYDIDTTKAAQVANQWDIPKCFASLDELAQCGDVVFDMAVPSSQILTVLEHLPNGATVLIQKPMGDDLKMAVAIRDRCREKRITAAINHQLRFAPQCLAAQSLIEQGVVGELHAMEVRVTVYTPWHLWKFLENMPRVEIQYHSVHYLDLIRHQLGDPAGVYCKTYKHPAASKLDSVRTYALLDYGDNVMVGLQVNHMHAYGQRHQESYIKWEGTRGAIIAQLGVLMNYPEGESDWLEYYAGEVGGDPSWQSVPLRGRWFPDAFIGPMANLQRYAAGEDTRLITPPDEIVNTMRLVEACYTSSYHGATSIPEVTP